MVMLGCKGFGKLNGSPRCTSTVSSTLSGTYLACSLGRENGRSVNSFKPDILP